MTDSIESLKSYIGTGLYEAEDEGVEREAVADLLERYAECVREGYPTLPEDRGRWHREAHDDVDTAESVTADD